MAKITQEQRNRYALKVKEYRSIIDGLVSKEQSMLNLLKQPGGQGIGYVRIKLAEQALSLTSYHILLNTLSVALLGIKNEEALTDARKTLVRCMKYIEDIVSGLIDAPFSEYEKNLEDISEVSYEDRFALVNKIGFTIREIEDGFGANSKWKWSFADIWGKHATLAKNLLNLKQAYQDIDFTSAHRPIVSAYVAFIKQQFQSAADRFREKYEMFSNKMDDFRQAIVYLNALRRIHVVFGERTEADELKKKIDIWMSKLESDQKKREEARKT
jgi:hypothetical protein